MTICPKSWLVLNDRYVVRRYCRCHGLRSQGKRVSRGDMLSAEMRRAYVRNGILALTRLLREHRSLDLKTAFETAKTIIGLSYEY